MADTDTATIAEREGFVADAHTADTDDDDGPLVVHGVALGEGVAHGTSGDDDDSPTYYPADVLADAADRLIGRKIVDDSHHDDLEATEPPNEAIVGEVTDAKAEPGVGVVYQGEVDRDPERSLIENGRVEVSPSLFRAADEYDAELGGRPVTKIGHWRDLAVVSSGGSPDASIQTGPAEALQAEALRAVFSPDDDTEPESHAAPTTAHSPTYSNTATQNWSLPTMGDFNTDDLSAIDNHYLVSTSGFPPTNFSDLALPVVSPSGTLHKQALKRMKTHAAQVTGLSGNTLERVKTEIDNLLEKEFDGPTGDTDTTAETNSPAHAGVRGDSKASDSELSAETMADTDTESSGEEGGDGEDDVPDEGLSSKSKEELVDMVREMRETIAEMKGQIKALDGDVENLQSNFAPLENQVVEAFAEKHDHDEEFVRENFDTGSIIEELGGPEAAAEVMQMTPNPQTGDPDPTSEKGGSLADLNSDDEAEIETLAREATLAEGWDEEYAESLRADAAKIAGVEDFSDIEGEVV